MSQREQTSQSSQERKVRWVNYVCPAGHRLAFGHLVSAKGKFQSGSPAACGCGQAYHLAELKD